MKFKNLKCGAIEEPQNKFAEKQMLNHPEVYEPVEDGKKKAEAKAEKPKAEAKK